MTKNWLKELQKLEGSVDLERNPHNYVVQSPSPSFNFIFGNGWGIPLGYSAILYGPPKAGKTVLVNAITGQLHKDDPEAIAIKFNTEWREAGQFSPIWGIDRDRYQAYEVNTPKDIFDRIEGPIADMCQQGAPIKLIVIDSMQGIQGRLGVNTSSVADIRPGDHALTIQEGLKRIAPVIHKYNIALIMTAHVRENITMGGGPAVRKTKMAGSWGLKHAAEYFVFVDKLRSLDGYKSETGEVFENKDLRDLKENAERTGHRIYFRMEENSVGPAGRNGIMTLDHKRGLINTHEEIAMLGIRRKVVVHPQSKSGGTDNSRYQYGEEVWHGKNNFINAVRDSKELQEKILMDLKGLDLLTPETE